MTCVELSNLSKQYTRNQAAVENVSLVIPDGKLTALLGPSGCGKTTILKMIAGLLPPSWGQIFFDGQSILHIPAERRGAVMVFQNHLLFPYLNVKDNVAFGLKMNGVSKTEIHRRVEEMLDLVQLNGYEQRKPSELSGGQQQRVALARALVVNPRVLLLDEPLSNLDAHLREEMRELILRLQRQKKITTVFVTHDQEEAVVLADQLALFFNGILHQVDQPHLFFEKPASMHVARFFGVNNFIPGRVAESCIETAIGKFRVQSSKSHSGLVLLTIRPENIKIISESNKDGNQMTGTVQSVVFNGLNSRIKIQKENQILEVLSEPAVARCYEPGDRIRLKFPAEKLWILPG